MKKRFLFCSVMILAVVFIPHLLSADEEMISKADRLFEENTLASYDKAIAVYQQLLEKQPDNFEAAWKCARARQWAGDIARTRQVDNWKKMCVRYGEAGMACAEKAIQLKPERVEGHYYRGCNAATCADGASVVRILRKNILGIIHGSFETAYEIDKKYDHGGVMQALGRYYFEVPWPEKDLEKALFYLRESQSCFPDDPCGLVFLAEILLESKDEKERAEAVRLLEIAADPDVNRFSPAVVEIYGGRAKELLEKLL